MKKSKVIIKKKDRPVSFTVKNADTGKMVKVSTVGGLLSINNRSNKNG
tara:strand:+ start:764 stop:907 length:144 start_codon:yes stop_codon:yes gene_type:complete